MVPMAQSLDDHIQDYIAHLAVERNLSPRTLESYARDLRQFSTWLKDEKLGPEQIERGHIRSYLGSRRDAGLSPRSSARALSAIRGLFRFLVADKALNLEARYRPPNGWITSERAAS